MMLQKSMAAVAFGAALIAFVLALNAPRLYRRARMQLIDQEEAAAKPV